MSLALACLLLTWSVWHAFRTQEMGPKLEKVETSAKDTERRLANLSTTVDLGAEDFKSFVNDVNAISEEVTAIGDKVDGMTAALDINALLMAAATQS